MIRKGFAAAVVALALTATACAEDAGPDNAGESRYSFYKVDDGFIRLDLQTGQVALCGRQTVGWACVSSPEDRTVLENEIARLQKENATLKQALLSHGLPLPSGAPAEGPPANDDKHLTLRLPTTEDIDRMVALVGHVWQRLVEAIANAENQVLHKG
ncbi:MAG TPA: hypothetical protein VMF32_07555 [Xanthobacteraceae bacterium]|nr:hypothetical protein [Xanthobacteraceae bacterium]